MHAYHAEVGLLGGRELAVKDVNEGEGRHQEGWRVFPDALKQVCTEFDEGFF